MGSTYSCLFVNKLDESDFSILLLLPQEKKSAYYAITPILSSKSFLITEHASELLQIDTHYVLQTSGEPSRKLKNITTLFS